MSVDSYKRPYQVRADYRKRDEIVLSDTDKLRLDYGRNSILLKAQAPFSDYPTDADLNVELPPARMRASALGIFEAVADVPEGASLGFQVQAEESGDWLYHDGGSWTAAGASDWNTEAEVSDNLSALVPLEAYLGFKINLVSTDGSETPEVYGVNFTYLSRVDPYEDFLYRVVLPFFKSPELWFNTEQKMDGADDFVILNLDGLGYQIEDVLSAYNLTTDSLRTTDISSGYTPATKTVALTVTPAADDIVEVRMLYKPDALSSVGVDYVELDRVPVFVIEDAAVEKVYHNLDDCVRNKAGKVAEVFEFEQSDWTLTVLAAAGRQVDMARMVRAIKTKIAESPFFYSYNFDEFYGVIWKEEPDFAMSQEISDLREARFTLEVHKVLLPLTEKGEPLVTQFIPILKRRVS